MKMTKTVQITGDIRHPEISRNLLGFFYVNIHARFTIL